MEKICEFCTASRPVVYCKADAAHLCLSCDARVHSANALSGRHFRTLLCQTCRDRPAYVRCINHEMFICRNCDRTLHGFSSQHKKMMLKTYMGCPSPKDFAVLWGFDMFLLDNIAHGDWFVSCSNGVADKGVPDSKISTGSSGQERRMNQMGNARQDNNEILQQIIGLKRIQLTEQKHNPSLLRGKEQTAEFSSTLFFETSRFLEDDLKSGSQLFPGISNDLQATDISYQGLMDQPGSSPFFQLYDLNSLATVGNLSTGDTLWQWKSQALGNQLWSQNMQDLGLCKEYECFDDIPDVDPTFRNFEDLFRGYQDPTRPLVNSEDVFSAFDISEQDYGKSSEGAPASRLYASDIQDIVISPIKASKGEASPNSGMPNSEGTQSSPRYNDKKKTRTREKEKQSRYSPRSDLKKRAKDHQTGSCSTSPSF